MRKSPKFPTFCEKPTSVLILEDERSFFCSKPTPTFHPMSPGCNALASHLDRDSAELPFVGELIQVVPDEDKWTGPIERLLRSFSLTIVLPPKLAKEAEAYLEENHLGDRLAFICPQPDPKEPKLHDDSVVAKLAVRTELDEIRQVWLRSALAERFPHLCKTKRDASFTKAKFAITLDGLIKSDAILREKDVVFFGRCHQLGHGLGRQPQTEKFG